MSGKELNARWRELLTRPSVRTVLGPDAEPEATHRAWPIPAVIRLGLGQNDSLQRTLLRARSTELALPRLPSFVYANADEGGFYRPWHEPALLRDVIAHAGRLSSAERGIGVGIGTG